MGNRTSVATILVSSAIILANPVSAQSVADGQVAVDEGAKYFNPFVPLSGDVVISLYTTHDNERTYDRFHVDNVDLGLDHLAPDQLRTRYPARFAPGAAGTVAGFSTSVSEMITDNNVLGVVMWGDYYDSVGENEVPAGQGSFLVTVPCLSTGPYRDEKGSLIDPEGFGYGFSNPYSVSFAGSDYNQAYQAYHTWLSGGKVAATFGGTSKFTAAQFRSAVYGCSVQRANQNPIAGNAGSLQFQIVNGGLDLAGTSANEDAPTTTSSGAPTVTGGDDSQWGVGLLGGRVEEAGGAGFQISGRVNRSFRVLEGSRSLLIVDVPVSYQKVAGREQFRIYGAASLVLPLSRIWTIEPRLAYGYTNSPQQQVKGQMMVASLTNRLFFNHLFGRGQATLGTMVAYSQSTGVKFGGQDVNEATRNWSVRGGGAYELPLKTRVFDRVASLRASYAYTRFMGDELFARDQHEATFSLGVRGREGSIRMRSEALRIGLSGRWSKGYRAYLGFIGYRF